VLLIRALYAAVFPLDLAPDESYYWDWGRRPDIGYFSKPPMIGWLMGLAGWLGNDSMFMLKFFPGLLTTLGLGFIYCLGRDTYGGWTGFLAVLLLLATPANGALATFFTIDAPLFLFWSASLWMAWRWWNAGTGRVGWALGLSVSLGLGYLTKQIQLVFPILLVGFLLLGRRRSWARGEGPQVPLILGVSLLFLLPPLLWNWRHDWITFRHTADELTDNPFRWGRSLRLVLEFVGGQAGLGGGVTWVLMVMAVVGVAIRWRAADERSRFLACFCLPGWVVFTALAFHQRVEQNWPLVFYSGAIVLAAGRFGGAVGSAGQVAGAGAGTSSPLIRWALGLGGVLALALLAVPFVFPRLPVAGAKSDPTARVRGWSELARLVEPFRKQLPRPEQTFLLAPDDRYVASALAYYLPDRPRTFGWEDPAHPESQYGIWGRPADRVGWDALVVIRNPESETSRDVAEGRFERWERLGEVVVRLGEKPGRERKYGVFLGGNLRGVGVKGADGRGGIEAR
jgi:4-amino-4-deoxy-L-arabinose transferase-like glycosyltransferase